MQDAPLSPRSYREFLAAKSQLAGNAGFEPIWIPEFLFDFQRALVEWAIRKGRAAIFADCGLGKTPMELVWAENVVRHTNKPVLIVTPLAVAAQTAREAAKFGIEAKVSRDGKYDSKIVITNYERLHYFDAADFIGAVAGEASAIKAFDGKRRGIGMELKPTYYRQAVQNVAMAMLPEDQQHDLLVRGEQEETDDFDGDDSEAEFDEADEMEDVEA